MHSLGIAHRDLKPCNVLMTTAPSVVVKLCDLGSAKHLDQDPDDVHTPFITSRPYRAIELLLGCCDYTTKIDMWSAGWYVDAPVLTWGPSKDH